MKCVPSFIAQGSTTAYLNSPSIPFFIMTYHGEPLSEFDPSTA
jgi:hypothetical protein